MSTLTDQTRSGHNIGMLMINIADAKANLSRLLSKVLLGEQVIISKAGKPIARIVPFNGSAKVRKSGVLKGQIEISPDFDELPVDLKKAFGML